MPSTPNPETPTLNIIGTGKLGRTLGRLFYDSGLVRIGSMYNRNIEHSQSAREFIGSGTVIKTKLSTEHALIDMGPATLWMIATPDDAIRATAEQLASVNPHTAEYSPVSPVVFHASGLKTSSELIALKKLGWLTASAHPAHSFANPQRSLSSFTDTVCTLEGNSTAITTLTLLFSAIGGQVTQIKPEAKALYHAATVMASNYLVALISASETLLGKAGIEEVLSSAILSPLMQQTLQNAFSTGPIDALTGPIARGDRATVSAHINAIADEVPELTKAYKNLGMVALELAKQQNSLSNLDIDAMDAILRH